MRRYQDDLKGGKFNPSRLGTLYRIALDRRCKNLDKSLNLAESDRQTTGLKHVECLTTERQT